MKNPLLDLDFLKELDRTNLKEVYAEILALNLNGEVLESIEGYVTTGNINVDGTSSVRRTCSLTLVANELNIHEYYWGLHTKFKLSIGVKNDINPEYPDIIWFKQGEFVITSFSTTQGTSNYTINIQGKDKMVLLNGELGGTIPSLTWDFGTVQSVNAYGDIIKERVLIKDIIIGAVHQFAKEPLYKIIVNDLEDIGLELLEYRGKDPMYILMNEQTHEFHNMTLDGDMEYSDGDKPIKLSEIPIYNPLFNLEQQGVVIDHTVIIDEKGTPLSVAKIEYGMTAGYRETDLVFAGDLIMQVGQSITMMLDKIIGMLGDFEYFFDLDGNFIFQRKPTYINLSWNNIINNLEEKYVENSAFTSAFSYSFEDGVQVISYSNNPNFANLRNDFTVWGARKGVGGASIPIHMRFAIDNKPFLFVNSEKAYYTSLSLEELQDFMNDYYGEKKFFYVKKKNPKGLSEDWWDIFDWAEYYKQCTGEYPDDKIGTYCTSGGIQFTEDELHNMFPRGSKSDSYFTREPVYIFDVEADGTLGYTGHGTYCSHSYTSYFINTLQRRGATAYIYKPVMPIDIIESAQDIFNADEINTDLDWREIIYQMALDYNKHHLEEDYYVNLSNNNYGLYTHGKTGYEQYYVDMEGFWRTIYCPPAEVQDLFEPAYPTKKTYLENCKEYYYNVPNYMTNKEEPYHSGVEYYSYQYSPEKDTNIMTKTPVTKVEYLEAQASPDPMPFYWVNPQEPNIKRSCWIVEPYRESGLGYYDANGNLILSEITYPMYSKDPSKYYYQKGNEYLPCANIEIYASNKSYFIYNLQEAKYEMVKNLTKSQYEANPSLYFYRDYTYTQCKTGDVFSEGTDYYRKTYNRTTDVEYYARVTVMTEEIFLNNPPMYYTRSEEFHYVNCVEVIHQYNPSIKYAKRLEEEDGPVYKEIAFKNEQDYQLAAAAGFIYYNLKIVECCEHPVDYDSLPELFLLGTSKYTETGWIKDLYTNPENLNFWFDFLDEESELQKYGNHIIGNRPKAINDTQVKSIYFRETPTVIFVDGELWDTTIRTRLGYTYLKLPKSMESLFSISSQGKSAKSVVDQFVYQYAQNAENINMTVLPMYYLEPNTRVFIRNDESGINGEYLINRFTLTLGSSGNMSVTASKAIDRLF